MTTRRLVVLALALFAATVVSAAAPSHPVFNPPYARFLVVAAGYVALVWAFERAKSCENALNQPRATPSVDGSDFVVRFDDRGLTLADRFGGIESAPWDGIDRITVVPDDDLLGWTGPYFLDLEGPGGDVSLPSCTSGLNPLLARLLQLPGVDREHVNALLRGDPPSRWTLWTRGQGGAA